MITYRNYYKVTKQDTPEKYEAILANVNDFVYFLTGTEKGSDIDGLDLKSATEEYLSKGGLNDEQIKEIKENILEP